MVYHKYKIEHYKYNESTKTYSSYVYITDAIAIDVNIGLGERADSFSISFINYDGSKISNFNLNDRLKIYMVIDGVETYLIEGVVEKISQIDRNNDLTLTISGLNVLEKCYNMLVAPTLQGTHTADEWIQHIISHMNEFIEQTELQLVWDSGNDTISSDYKIPYTKGYTQVFKMFEELSKPENTDGNEYLYWIDENNHFIWKKKTWNIDKEINSGTDIINLKSDKAMWDIVNYVIMKCGKSPYGMEILEFDYDNTSMGKYGPKIKVVHSNIAEELMTQEIKRFKNENVYTEGETFPNTYPYIPSFTLYEKDGSLSSSTSVSNDSDYNECFVNYVRKIARNEIQGILRVNTTASWKTTIDTINLSSYTLGNLYKVYDKYTNWLTGSPDLRVMTFKYHFDKNGWTLAIQPEEDRLMEE